MFKTFFIFFIFIAYSYAQVDVSNLDKSLFKNATSYFYDGKYEKTIEELNLVYQKLKESKGITKEKLGLIFYWRGISFSRLQEYPSAIKNFQLAKKLNFVPDDLHYELAQSLFASEKLKEARIEFKHSFDKKIKKAVSLYYIGYISKELREYSKAYTYLLGVEKLEDPEAEEVKQPAAFMLGDIYLDQAERDSDVFHAVRTYVIPQYEKAYNINPKSNLASKIKEKKIEVLKKYDLVLFQFRNGRPASYPPYFLRASSEVGMDSNVTFSPNDTTIDKSKQSSAFGKLGGFGKYSFFYDDYLSISPELGINYTRYINRQEEIFRNDNISFTGALRSSYEHKLFEKVSSILLDWDYGYIERDVEAKNQLSFNSRSHAFSFGERIVVSSSNEISLRVKHRNNDSYLDNSDSNTLSFSYDQILVFPSNTILLYLGYDRLRMKDSVFDTNSFTLRIDTLLPSFKGWFEPSLGFLLTQTDPINDRASRGNEILYNPSVRISKSLSSAFKGHVKLEYQENKSRNEDSFSYRKMISSFELEYIY